MRNTIATVGPFVILTDGNTFTVGEEYSDGQIIEYQEVFKSLAEAVAFAKLEDQNMTSDRNSDHATQTGMYDW